MIRHPWAVIGEEKKRGLRVGSERGKGFRVDGAVRPERGGSADHGSRITGHEPTIPYFPGCALKDQARGFELSAAAAMEALGYRLSELPRWNCCGTVYSLSTDDLMRHVAPVRNLVRVQEMGEWRLVTLCAMCYNTLRRSARFVEEDPDRLRRINAFMDDEPDYRGGVEVLHLLRFLADEVGFESVGGRVVRPLQGLKVSAYYGCMLLRPRSVGIDDPDAPEIVEELLLTLGAEPVDSPQKVECCGAYRTVPEPEVARERVAEIVSAARRRGAETIVTSCPLCHFNLEERQGDLMVSASEWEPVPVLYFTQLLALALGVPTDKLGLELLKFDPRPLLSERELIQEG